MMVEDWSASVKAKIKQQIGNMVDDWVNAASVWNEFGSLLDIPYTTLVLVRWNHFP